MRPGGTNLWDRWELRCGSQTPHPYDAYPLGLTGARAQQSIGYHEPLASALVVVAGAGFAHVGSATSLYALWLTSDPDSSAPR